MCSCVLGDNGCLSNCLFAAITVVALEDAVGFCLVGVTLLHTVSKNELLIADETSDSWLEDEGLRLIAFSPGVGYFGDVVLDLVSFVSCSAGGSSTFTPFGMAILSHC